MTTILHTLLVPIIRKRRPGFSPDPELNFALWVSFLWQQLISFLRSWRLLIRGRWPKQLFLGHGARMQHLSKIKLGAWVRLEEGVLICAFGKGLIQIGNQVRIGAYSRLITSTSPGQLGEGIQIGNNVGIGEFAYLGGAAGLSIGNDCIIGQYFSCHPENHRFSQPDIPIRLQGVERKGIVIEDNCWIGAKVTVLDGVRIGCGCVIAAGAVVTKNIPPNSIIGGVPARILRPRFSSKHNN